MVDGTMPRTVLLVGGDSLIGCGVAKALRQAGVDVIVTTRRRGMVGKHFLDLREEEKFVIPQGIDAAVVAAGIGGFKYCEDNPEALLVNAVKTPAFVRRLLKMRVFTVFLSTSSVFAQTLVRPDEESLHCPSTAYGKQKSQAEQTIKQHAAALDVEDRFCVIRLTKVVCTSVGPAIGWLKAWRDGDRARAFSDVRFSPVGMKYCVDGICQALCVRASGSLHLSGEEGISYSDFCSVLAKRLDISDAEIEVTTSEEAGVFAPFKPVEGALGMEMTIRKIGIKPQPMADVIGALLDARGSNGEHSK